MFYLDGGHEPCGVIVTERNSHALRCAISFCGPGGDILESHCSIVTSGAVQDWTSLSFVSAELEMRTVRRSDIATEVGPKVIPGYGFSLYLLDCWTEGVRSAQFGWLDEASGGTPAVEPARFDTVGVEDVLVPFHAKPIIGAHRVQLAVSGQRTNTYWIHQGRIVKSDWNGASSYALSADVASRLFLAVKEIHDEPNY